MADKKKETKETKGTKGTKASPKLEKIIGEIEKLSVLELSDLVKTLEDKFGVSAIPVAAAPAAAAAPAEAGAEKEEAAAKSKLNLILTDVGAKKIDVIKAVREVNQDLGLKEAKDLVEAAPKEVLHEVGKEEAEAAKKKLEVAGAEVELK